MARSKNRPYLKVMVLVGIVVVFIAFGWRSILEFASILNVGMIIFTLCMYYSKGFSAYVASFIIPVAMR